jgi:aspartyl-tRNA(Asn)/glutamyl-tRNA(Gln) amidotransferase subunit C
MIDKEQVKHVAKLARLSISDSEVESFTHHLGSVLDYVEQLNAADTSNVEPTAFVAPTYDPMRDDVPAESLTAQQLLANGPKVTKGHFAVPKVIQQ